MVEDPDNDCEMPEMIRHDDDTDIESFEREEKRMEEEAAKVSLFEFGRKCVKKKLISTKFFQVNDYVIYFK